MSEVLKLPAINIVRGVRFDQVWQFVSARPEPRTPINLVEWSGVMTIANDLESEPLLEVPLGMAITGDISASLTEAQTADLNPDRRVGGRAAAVFQITLRAPFPEFDQVWQGAVSISGGDA